MKNKDILSYKLKEILEKEPLIGRFLENMAMHITDVKNRNLIGDKKEVETLLNYLLEDFEMMGIKEDI
jgi:hypothetical protein